MFSLVLGTKTVHKHGVSIQSSTIVREMFEFPSIAKISDNNGDKWVIQKTYHSFFLRPTE